MDVISLFVSKPSTSNSLTSQYLEIFRFHQIDFMCFEEKGIVGIYSVFHKEIVVFFFVDNSQKNTLRQIPRYITPGSTDFTKSYNLVSIFFSVYLPSWAFKRAMNLCFYSRCVYLLFVNIPCS